MTRSTATINAFKNDAPWVLIQDFDARNFDHRPIMDKNIPAEKRTLDEGKIFTKDIFLLSFAATSPFWPNSGVNLI